MMAGQWVLVACLLMPSQAVAGGGGWDRIGPYNIFDAIDTKGAPTGEAGTLACAASPASNPDLIYAGGQNNGVSSGIIKTIDGGKHWTRSSAGLWDTRILGVWLHPGDKSGNHVLVGTHSGIYESTDGASSWNFRNETKGFGNVMSFREGLIDDKPYILANAGNAILTLPMSGGLWQSIKAPGGIAPNAHLSVVIHQGKTEVLTCIGGWGGGQLYYATLDSPSSASWSKPITTSNGTKIDCANAAVDPNDRNHFLYSKGGEYHVYESKDGGKTTAKIGDQGAYFVMIGSDGALYTATQDGAFVTHDDGKTWKPYHVVMHVRPSATHPAGKVIDRVAHDYQRIVPDFRGDQIAFPSDQGLHIVDMKEKTNYQLISAVGDMHNAMALSALISPGDSGKKEDRKIVVNMWDWNVVASWDDGKTWPNWKDGEKAPDGCGEGGGGQGMGASGHVVMFHRNNWWASEDGGHNFQQGTLPGSAGGFDYVRKAGSRSAPAGTCFSLMDAPLPTPPPPTPPPTPPPPPTPQPAQGWASFQDKSLRCSGSEFKGNLGTFDYWNQCQEACRKKDGIDFAVWRSKASGGDNNCYACDLSGRGPPSSWKLDKAKGSVSLELLPPKPTPAPAPSPAPPGTKCACLSTGAKCPRGFTCGLCTLCTCPDPSCNPAANHTCYWDIAPTADNTDAAAVERRRLNAYNPAANDGNKDDTSDDGNDENDEETNPHKAGYVYSPGVQPSGGNVKSLMTSHDFGLTWTFLPMPAKFQAGSLAVDPTNRASLFGYTTDCLAQSKDNGVSWSPCSTGKGLTGRFSKLLIKNSKIMFMLRSGAVPLRTTDGGANWEELSKCAPLFKYGATFDGSISWTGNTLVLSGVDLGAINRGEYGTAVWKSSNDGDDWTDETGDLVTISPGPGEWAPSAVISPHSYIFACHFPHSVPIYQACGTTRTFTLLQGAKVSWSNGTLRLRWHYVHATDTANHVIPASGF
jgi:photosystem II stability/assembly factor-like uncharacterized protein